jgi:hypothetical protein
VSPGKMIFEIGVRRVVDMLVFITAQMAIQMHSIQMVHEYHIIEVILLAKITPRMRQDLCLLIVSRISLLYMELQGFDII